MADTADSGDDSEDEERGFPCGEWGCAHVAPSSAELTVHELERHSFSVLRDNFDSQLERHDFGVLAPAAVGHTAAAASSEGVLHPAGPGLRALASETLHVAELVGGMLTWTLHGARYCARPRWVSREGGMALIPTGPSEAALVVARLDSAHFMPLLLPEAEVAERAEAAEERAREACWMIGARRVAANDATAAAGAAGGVAAPSAARRRLLAGAAAELAEIVTRHAVTKCGVCGLPKKGHVCTGEQADPDSDADADADLDSDADTDADAIAAPTARIGEEHMRYGGGGGPAGLRNDSCLCVRGSGSSLRRQEAGAPKVRLLLRGVSAFDALRSEQGAAPEPLPPVRLLLHGVSDVGRQGGYIGVTEAPPLAHDKVTAKNFKASGYRDGRSVGLGYHHTAEAAARARDAWASHEPFSCTSLPRCVPLARGVCWPVR
ncbi:hypothetical protein T492DRAFT_471838 [Pavlovales sp. CCMP2436]|nr:hypothetical protein T492DRAFT_471838 [Pavlovales sp. CCMP2436]